MCKPGRWWQGTAPLQAVLLAFASVAALMAGCSAVPPSACASAACAGQAAQEAHETHEAQDSAKPVPPTFVLWQPSAVGLSARWQHLTFPGKAPTVYQPVRLDGREVMEASSQGSASMLRQSLRLESAQLRQLRFSWRVPALIDQADFSQRQTEDSPVRVVLAFEGDRSGWSLKNKLLSELAQAVTGEPMPYATLMYVWSNQTPQGTVVHNPRTDRIRKLVLESGPGQLGQWLDYERDVRADFEKAFGEPAGALLSVGIMTDSDNTHSQAQAWYGPLALLP